MPRKSRPSGPEDKRRRSFVRYKKILRSLEGEQAKVSEPKPQKKARAVAKAARAQEAKAERLVRFHVPRCTHTKEQPVIKVVEVWHWPEPRVVARSDGGTEFYIAPGATRHGFLSSHDGVPRVDVMYPIPYLPSINEELAPISVRKHDVKPVVYKVGYYEDHRAALMGERGFVA